jgi:Protein of unknown function DUF262
MNILDYCNAFLAGDIKVDPNYQRTDRVWPDEARQYLIETIILGYPVPKFFLHQKIDLKSKKSMKFVVDGQQRSRALVDFFAGKFSMSKKTNPPQLAGKTFDMLDDNEQNAFLSYSLPIDLFVTASREEIIETFRRINSYTVPLNAEELRHANNQGEMKWFVYDLAKTYSERLALLGTLTEKNLARMVDLRFFSEIVCFIVNEKIVTTNAKLLDDLYTRHDKFADSIQVRDKIDFAMNIINKWNWLQGLNVVKQHILGMIILSIINESPIRNMNSEAKIKEGFSELSEAIETGSSAVWSDFVKAAEKTTNDRTRKFIIYESVTKVIFG